MAEKHQSAELLTETVLNVCRLRDASVMTLRRIEKDLLTASQLEDMRELKAKLAECVTALGAEADAQDTQQRELKALLAESARTPEELDQVTGLTSLANAEARFKELAEAGRQSFVLVYFLKNVDVVNRRFGFTAGDEVLRKFAHYLKSNFRATEQVFRWRGPCFVVVAERVVSLDAVQAEAQKLGMRGPDVDVEGNSKSMLIRLTAATTAFAIPNGSEVAGLPAKIDQFAAGQFKVAPGP